MTANDAPPDARDMASGPQVSVVIPSYNHAAFLEDCIRSVQSQTLTRWELIIIDDGSTDNSRNIIQAFAGRDARIKYVFQENSGASHAINRGLGMARSEYLSILNSDDRYHPHRLETLWNVCNGGNIRFLTTGVHLINASGDSVPAGHPWLVQYARILQSVQENGLLRGLFFGNYTVSTSNFFFHRSAWALLGEIPHLRFNHDWAYAARALSILGKDYDFLADEKLLDYRLHGNNTINSNPIRSRLELYRLQRQMAGHFGGDIEFLVRCIHANQRSLRREVAHLRLVPVYESLAAANQRMDEQALQLDQAGHEMNCLKQALATSESELKGVLESKTYRLGRILTSPYRWVASKIRQK